MIRACMTSLVHEMQMQTCAIIRIQSDSCNCLIWQNRALNPTNPMHLPQTTSPQHIPVAMMRCNGMFTQHVHCMQQGTVCACGKHAAAAVSDTCGGSWAARHHGFGGELYLLCGMPKTDIALHSSSKSAPLGCSGDPNCLRLSPRPQNTSRHH